MSRQQQRVMSAITGANEDDYSSKFKKMQESLIQLKMMEMLYNTGKQQLLIIKSEPGIDVDVNDNIIWARHHHPPTPPSPVPTPTPTVPILGTIAVVNLSQSVTNQQLEAWMAAVKQQADTHVVPWWGYSINYVVIPEGKKPPKSDWYMTVADTIDSPNAAGYHDVDQNGNPIIKVDAQDTPVSVTISHEVCETISDENANTIVTGCMDTINNKPCEMYRESCLTGDTKIALLDGTNVPISQLVGRHHFWVYSIDSNGHIKPGRATNARLTRKDAHVFELTLDNGEVVKATDDHRIMMRDGTFKPVVGLKINDSVMPLYRRLQQITKGSRKDYEQTYDPTSNEWLFTHRIVTNGNRCKIFNADPGHRQMLANLVRTPEARQRAAATAKKVSHNRWHLKRGLVNENCEYCTPAPRVLNHKVIGIKYAGQEDVYDITVEGYHNFALSSGMFVHNCDPVENDTYLVNNVQVSNFITKNWFKPGSQGPYDFLRLCKEPCEIRDGGYMAVNYTGNPNGWTQIDKFSKRKDRHLSKGSRHEIYRKRVAKETLKTSTFEVDENWDVRKHNVNQANKQQEAAQQQSEQFGPELMDKIKQFVIQLFTDEEK